MKEIGFFKDELTKWFNKNELNTLIHFVTSRCNAKCDFCFYSDELNASDELSLDEITAISKNLSSLKSLLLSGGEPYIRDDLVDIVGAYVNNCHVDVVQIPTNGYLTEKIVLSTEKLLSSFPDLNLTIAVSLDCLGDEHDKQRNLDQLFSKAQETLQRLIAMRDRNKSFRVIVVSVLTKDNLSSYRDLAEYVKNRIGPDLHWFEPVRAAEEDKPHLSKDDLNFLYENLKYYLQKAKHSSSSIYASGFFNKAITNFSLKNFSIAFDNFVENKLWPVKCCAGDKIAVLYPNGDIAPCELQNKVENVKNFDMDIKKVLKHEGFEDIKRRTKKHLCDCTHGCFIPVSVRYSPFELLRTCLVTSRSNKG